LRRSALLQAERPRLPQDTKETTGLLPQNAFERVRTISEAQKKVEEGQRQLI
jgi:hypothetical protein